MGEDFICKKENFKPSFNPKDWARRRLFISIPSASGTRQGDRNTSVLGALLIAHFPRFCYSLTNYGY